MDFSKIFGLSGGIYRSTRCLGIVDFGEFSKQIHVFWRILKTVIECDSFLGYTVILAPWFQRVSLPGPGLASVRTSSFDGSSLSSSTHYVYALLRTALRKFACLLQLGRLSPTRSISSMLDLKPVWRNGKYHHSTMNFVLKMTIGTPITWPSSADPPIARGSLELLELPLFLTHNLYTIQIMASLWTHVYHIYTIHFWSYNVNSHFFLAPPPTAGIVLRALQWLCLKSREPKIPGFIIMYPINFL